MHRKIAAVLTLGALTGLSAACSSIEEPVLSPEGTTEVSSYQVGSTSWLAVKAPDGTVLAAYPESVPVEEVLGSGVAVRVVRPSAPSPQRSAR